MKIQRNNSAAGRGFTLMELILVMLVMAIVAAVAAPNLRNFIAGRRSGDTAAQIVALAHFARSQAISEGRVYQLNVEPREGRVFVTTLDAQNVMQPVTSDVGGAVQLPGALGDMRIDSDLPVGDGGAQIAKFYPTGRTDIGTITVTDDRGIKAQVVCRSASENYHVATGSEIR